MKNEILTEVWKNRDEFAKRHDYDLDAMVADLQEMERRPWSTLVDRSTGKTTKLIDSEASRLLEEAR